MNEQAQQIIARGPRAVAEAAAEAIDADVNLEGATYSILEEDEDRDIWRIDAFPTSDTEADGLRAALAEFPALRVVSETLADADWLAMALSGLPLAACGPMTSCLRPSASAVCLTWARAPGCWPSRPREPAARSWSAPTSTRSRCGSPGRMRWSTAPGPGLSMRPVSAMPR